MIRPVVPAVGMLALVAFGAIAGAIASGAGVSRATLDAATRGVVVER